MRAIPLTQVTMDPSVVLPPHVQLAASMRREIVEGRLKAGDRVPTVRELAGRCRVSSFTVSRALQGLVAEGLLVTRQRAGTFVARRQMHTFEVLVPCWNPSSVLGAQPNDSLFLELDRGIRECAPAGGCRTFFSYANAAEMSAAEMSATCRARRTTGVVAFQMGADMERLLNQVCDEIPVVYVHPFSATPRCDAVSVNVRAVFGGVLRRRIEAGARAIALVGFTELLSHTEKPYAQMYRTTMELARAAGIEPTVSLHMYDGPWQEQLASLGRRLPDGALVVALSPRVTDAVDAGTGRLDVVTFTESQRSMERLKGRATLLYAGVGASGAAGARAVLDRVEGRYQGAPRVIEIEPEVVEGRGGR